MSQIDSCFRIATALFFVLLVLFEVVAHYKTNESKKTYDLLALVSLCLLGLSETVGLPFSFRKDTLYDKQIAGMSSRQDNRNLDAEKFVRFLKGKPKGRVSIWYARNDTESYVLAEEIYDALGEGRNGSGAGWDSSKPEPIPELQGTSPNLENAPACVRLGPGLGLGLLVDKLMIVGNSAQQALSNALGASTGTGITLSELPSLPSNSFVVVVCPKQ